MPSTARQRQAMKGALEYGQWAKFDRISDIPDLAGAMALEVAESLFMNGLRVIRGQTRVKVKMHRNDDGVSGAVGVKLLARPGKPYKLQSARIAEDVRVQSENFVKEYAE